MNEQKVCATCQEEIDVTTQCWVDTHVPNQDGPYFHMNDECWDGDPHYKYPRHNGVMASGPPLALTARERRVADQAADLWIEIAHQVPEGSNPVFIEMMEGTANEIRKGWCLEETVGGTIDRVCFALRNIADMRERQDARHHAVLAGSGFTAGC